MRLSLGLSRHSLRIDIGRVRLYRLSQRLSSGADLLRSHLLGCCLLRSHLLGRCLLRCLRSYLLRSSSHQFIDIADNILSFEFLSHVVYVEHFRCAGSCCRLRLYRSRSLCLWLNRSCRRILRRDVLTGSLHLRLCSRLWCSRLRLWSCGSLSRFRLRLCRCFLISFHIHCRCL